MTKENTENTEDLNTIDFLPEFDTEDIPETPEEVAGQYFARITELKLLPPTEKKINPTLLLKVKYEGNEDKTASDETTLVDSLPPAAIFYTIPVAEDRGVMIGANKTTDKAEMFLRNLKYLFNGLGYDQVNNNKVAELVNSKELEGTLVQFTLAINPNENNPEKPYKNYNYIKKVVEG